MLHITNKWLVAIGCLLTLASHVALADDEEPLIFSGPNIIDRLASGTTPLDDRERISYQSQIGDFKHRQKFLELWLNRTAAASSFNTLEVALRQDFPETWDTLINKNKVDLANLRIFFAESLLFFKMVRNNQSKALIDDQFLTWRDAWMKIDMRLMPKAQAQAWSAALLEVYALAFIEAGPWTTQAETRLDTYYGQRPEFQQKSRIGFARALIRLASFDTKRESRAVGVLLAGFFIPMFPSLFTAAYVMNQMNVGTLSMTLVGVVAGFTPSMLAAYFLPKSPRAYEYLGKRFSVMFSPSGPRCQDLLNVGKRHEKQ